jgi:predicted GIY-YIG superfamily endonuclease
MNQYIYRLYASNDQLLYIGITNDPSRRFKDHANQARWYSLAVRHDTRRLDCDENEAKKVERNAIIKEKPLHNVIHNTPAEDKLTRSVLFRLTDEDFERLDNACYTTRTPKAKFIRDAVNAAYDLISESRDILKKPKEEEV